MQKVACDLKEAQERKDLTILVVGSSHAVRALDVWFLRSSACVTGEKWQEKQSVWVFCSVSVDI